MESQGTPNSQNNLEKRTKLKDSYFLISKLTYYKATVITVVCTGIKRHTENRHIEENREPRNKPSRIWSNGF